MSSPYRVSSAPTSPPVPKQPQSMANPRVHAETIPAMKTIMSSPATAPTYRVASPTTSSSASANSNSGRV